MLEDRVFIGGVWVNSNLRGANTVGTMLDLTELAETLSGEAISDIYTLVASAVAGGSGTITVSTAAPDNYINGTQAVGVLFDGVTIYRNIIPGVALVFNLTTANGNTSTVQVGMYVGAIDAFGAGVGDPVAVTRHQVHNPDLSDVEGAVASISPLAAYVKKVGTIFSHVAPYAPGATYKPLGGGSDQINPYRITVSNVAGVGAAKTCTILVDGFALGATSVLDVDTGVEQDSNNLKAIDPPYIYEIVEGDLTGVRFSIDPGVLNTHTANILIFPPRYIQITGEISPGVADDTGWGTADVPLTEAGEAEGVITAGGDAYYWSRAIITSGASSQSNPWQGWVFLSAIGGEGANWDG